MPQAPSPLQSNEICTSQNKGQNAPFFCLEVTASLKPAETRLHPAGLEPTTYSSGGCRSIQLSYGCVDREVRAFRAVNQAVRA